MKLRTTLAALAAASLCTLSFAAQAQPTPPTPRPAAGALPQTNPNAVQRTFRTQTRDEQQTSATSVPMDVGQSGRARVAAQSSNPPTPRPAAGALPQTNPNAVQKTFRTQTRDEQQSSTATSPMDVGQSGRTRSPN